MSSIHGSLPAAPTAFGTSAAATPGKFTPMDSSNPSTSGGAFSTTNLGSTFLSLLGQELQNQDPTQPMSATEEVGQMISLNQLDQLVSINSVLTGAAASSSSSGTGDKATSHAVSPSSSTPEAASTSAAPTADKLAAVGALSSTQPLDLGTLMSLFGGK
jgi:flagellar basal-body rod modification protein FlgD